ncbi:cobalt-precorrin-5B (C(1))-methyltransferase [Acuticoccus sp. MNP-M23]|uniref:cobalt-precorrin-5B (C(1))-methyltransferase n=1 Tax=Acuticoccus sp. MNP-M23 TaxID=3072793 RepID=UPI0028167A6B|nr:cobalt-precorrin-5B (C(1))-methyltransferase [Acuticoccus sp. MNP-M23]WMS43282.1 cobalt-precorrin-5B (C(1))-methyltransferase [Acuticoccus sp. MNP-M23]
MNSADPPHHGVPGDTPEPTALRRGWTTGACAAAAAKAAAAALLSGTFPDPVTITLPGGQTPAFALARHGLEDGAAFAAIVKDAGDDPDVTHGALVWVRVTRRAPGAGLGFAAGEGVGMVTLPGLPVPPGEPAINPHPRAMIAAAIGDVAPDLDFGVEIGVEDGRALALKTLNPRLGIVGGLSILGTTGIVIPFSCAAWIHSIHRGIDVARATGHDHVAASTGSVSEQAVQRLHGLADAQLIEMGDFVGGTLKYLKAHPVAKVTLAGGPAKMTKLGQGMLDVHSKRGRAEMGPLAAIAAGAGGSAAVCTAIETANTVAEAFQHAQAAGLPLGDLVAERAWGVAAPVLGLAHPVSLEVVLFDRAGTLVGRTPMRPVDRS